jgi:hypothetical protein
MSTDPSYNMQRETFRRQVEANLRELGVDILKCRSCDEPLIFLKTTKGKWHPVNMYLESHFSDCPAAKTYRKHSEQEDLL